MFKRTKQRRLRCRGCGADEPYTRSNPSQWWLPGIVVVEFKKRVSPGQILGSPHSPSEGDLHWLDLEKFRQIVGNLPIKRPEWTFSYEGDGPPAPNYARFVTFYLQPDVNVPQVAKALSTVGGVVRASGEPRLSPPKQRIPLSEPASPVYSETGDALLDEPLAVSGGEPLGLAVSIGTEQLQSQWYLFRSRADQTLNNGIDGSGVVVVDVDWGFNVNHQEFANDKIKFKYNAAKTNDIVSSGPKVWHGTGTLGLIGAGDNDKGMLGFAPGADLWAIQAQDESESISNSHWGNAIIKAYLQPSEGKPKVILVEASTDLGYNVEWSTTVREPIKEAIKAGCVVCVTAGNSGENVAFDEDGFPIEESGSILIGATKYGDPNIIEPGTTNWGSRVLVSAPAADTSDVTCCDCGADTYTNNFGGTSGAAAKVAGAMALVLQTYPQIKHEQIVRALAKIPSIPTTTGRPIGCFLDVPTLITKAGEVLAEDENDV